MSISWRDFPVRRLPTQSSTCCSFLFSHSDWYSAWIQLEIEYNQGPERSWNQHIFFYILQLPLCKMTDMSEACGWCGRGLETFSQGLLARTDGKNAGSWDGLVGSVGFCLICFWGGSQVFFSHWWQKTAFLGTWNLRRKKEDVKS